MSTSSRKPSYEAALALVALLLLLQWFYAWPWLLPTTLIVTFLALLFAPVARGITWLWDKVTKAIGWVTTRMLLGLVFYLLLTPLAWVSRFFRGDQLDLKNTKDSLFTVRDHTYEPRDLENPW